MESGAFLHYVIEILNLFMQILNAIGENKVLETNIKWNTLKGSFDLFQP